MYCEFLDNQFSFTITYSSPLETLSEIDWINEKQTL